MFVYHSYFIAFDVKKKLNVVFDRHVLLEMKSPTKERRAPQYESLD